MRTLPLIWCHVQFIIQVEPGKPGAEVSKKKNCKSKKEFAYRMCARRPTSAMPKPFLCCEPAFCCSMVGMWPVLMHVMSFDVVVMSFDAMWLLVLCHVTWCNAMSCDVRSCDVPCNGHVVCSKCFCDKSVLQGTTPVLLCTTKYYSSTTLYYTVLQRTTPVLLCTAKYYSSTTLYYKVLLQYYSVLQSATPVLLCTTKYYSSTTLYCKVLLQYYSVLQSATPVLLCTTLHSTTTYYSSTTLYYKVQLQYYSVLGRAVLQSTTPVLPCTTKYYSSTTLYYTVLQRTTPVRLCTTKQHSSLILDTYEPSFTWLMSVAYETSFTMRGATGVILQLHQILRLPRKMVLMIDVPHIWNVIYNARSNKHHPPTSPNTAPATLHDSHDWSSWHMKHHLQCAEQQASPSNLTKYSACHEKWCASSVVVTVETSFTMRGATGITLQPHQILRLPRKTMRIIDPRHIWNVIYNARSNKHHPPTSPNTAPATQNDSHDWCPSHMKRHLQCAEQQASPSNLTKYCACHAKLHSKILEKLSENSWSVIYNARPIRAWSEHDPSMIRPWTRHLAPARSRRLHFVLRRRILYWKLQHFALRLSTQISPNTAPATKSDTPRSPNAAPATKNDSHDWYPWHMKRHLQCAEQQASPCNLTKYCACHAKWLSWLIFVTYGTSFTMRGATGITLQPHQILRLPRKSALQDLSEILRERLKRQFQCAADSTMIRAWSEHDPTMIRAWSDHELVISHPPVRRGYFSRFGDAFCIENYNISRSGYLPKFHPILCLPRKMTLQHHQMLRLPRKVTLQDHQILLLPRKVALQDHQMLRLPQKVNCYWAVTQLSCYWTVTQLSCYWTVTELSCYWTVTDLSWTCYSSELLLNCYSSELLLNCYSTELLLNCYSTELLLNCYSTELLLNCYWTELLLNCYWTELNLLLKWAVTELLLNWAEPVTQVSCYWTVTQVSCYWTVTQLSCYWTVTQLSWTCYSTELLLNCYSSELLLNWAVIAFLKLRNSEVSHLNFLWR